MTRRVPLFCLCLALAACSPKLAVWTSPAVSLPISEHAVVLPVRQLAMVSRSVTFKRLEEMAEGCAERAEALPPEPEEEPEEEEAPAKEQVPTKGESPAAEPLNEAELTTLVASTRIGDLLREADEEPERPAELPEPIGLPDDVLAPAVLLISLDQMTWMGEVVATLKNGALLDAGETLLIARLHKAVEASVQATKGALRQCDLSPFRGVAALIVADARVPQATFNRAVYTLGMSGVGTFAIAVSDSSPRASRLTAPVGARDRVGHLETTPTTYVYKGQEAYRGDSYMDDKPPERSPPVIWPRDSPLPKRLGEDAPPGVFLSVGTRPPVSQMVSVIDALAGHQTYCVSLALGKDETTVEPPPLAPPTTLRFDVRGTVVAHLLDSPFGGSGYTRMDGARCERSRVMMLETRGDLPASTEKPPRLEDAFGDKAEERPALERMLDSARETPEEPLGKTPPESK